LKKIVKEQFFNNIGLTCNFAEFNKVICEVLIKSISSKYHNLTHTRGSKRRPTLYSFIPYANGRVKVITASMCCSWASQANGGASV